ncbi:MAG: proline racemase family protein, partial [Thermoanaerobaculia bacterium]
MRISSMIQAVDTHVCGEPARVIVGGVLDVPGATMFEKMTYLENEADELRLRMLREPRGYPAANCNLILPPTHPDAHAGYVIMEQTEYPGMSGTNTIAVTTVLIETGMVPVQEPLTELLLES